MWTKMKWAFRIVLALFVLGFLHYTLPQHDIVQITNTYNRLTTVGPENSWAYSVPDVGTAESTTTRDIRFIDAAYPDGGTVADKLTDNVATIGENQQIRRIKTVSVGSGAIVSYMHNAAAEGLG